jgi:hypothetical protein
MVNNFIRNFRFNDTKVKHLQFNFSTTQVDLEDTNLRLMSDKVLIIE